jgi:aminopeptidase N
VPPGTSVASAGLSSVEEETDGRRTFTWKLRQPIPTYLVALNVAPWAVAEGTYVSLDGTRTMPVRSYLLPSHLARNEARLAAIPSQITSLASLFGEYPFLDSKYGIVEASFQGGMEHPTLTSIGTNLLGSTTRDLTLLFVHELAHQWWGDWVTMKTWDDIFLNEGFATYAEILYLEREEGLAPGAVLTEYYDDGLYAGALGPAVVAPLTNPFAYTGAVYEKGAWVLHMLRCLIGDEAFFEGLRLYGERHAWGSATRGDLRSVMEETSALDLKPFFDQWVETRYRPVLRGTLENLADASRLSLTVRQLQTHVVVHPSPAASDVSHYRFPLTVRAAFDDGTTARWTVSVDLPTQTFELPNPARRRAVVLTLDPDGDLLKVVETAGVGAKV